MTKRLEPNFDGNSTNQFLALAEILEKTLLVLSPKESGDTCELLYTNKAFFRKYGYKEAELSEFSTSEIIGFSEADASQKKLESLRSGELTDLNCRIRQKDGTYLIQKGNASKIPWAGSEAILWVEDESVRPVEPDEKLRESIERFRFVFQATNQIIWDWNLEINQQYLADNFYPLFNYTKAEIETSHEGWKALLHPDDLLELTQSLQHFVSGESGDYWCVEYRLKRGDGTYAHVLDRAILIRDKSGKPIRILGSMEDISKEKAIAQNLIESEERHRLIVDHQTELIYKCRPDSTITFVNQAFSKFLNIPIYELIGRKLYDFLPDEELLRERVNFAAIIEGKTPCTSEACTYDWQGTLHWHLWKDIPILNADGEVGEILSVGTDITELNLARKYQSELNRQLLQSQKMESIGRLAGGLAHDVNNMLSAILLHSDNALMELDREHPCAASIEKIQLAAERSTGIIRQLLTIARKQPVALQRIQVNNSVVGIQKLFTGLLGSKITLKCELEEGIDLIECDGPQLDQVLTNLMVNARDALNDDGGEISISTKQVFLSAEECKQLSPISVNFGEFICLSVSDTGQGIPEDLLQRIFEPFFTTKEPQKGTGLGLAIVYGIVTQHGGAIRVSSKVDFGTRFELFFPVRRN
ncbi:MAG: PAS domain-containing protein [Sumerlaeia bacterium]